MPTPTQPTTGEAPQKEKGLAPPAAVNLLAGEHKPMAAVEETTTIVAVVEEAY